MGTAYAFVYLDMEEDPLKELVDNIIKKDVIGEGNAEGYGFPETMKVEPYLIENVTEGQIKGRMADVVELYKPHKYGRSNIDDVIWLYSHSDNRQKTDYNPEETIYQRKSDSQKPNYVLVADYPGAPNKKTADKLVNVVNDICYWNEYTQMECPRSENSCIIGEICYEEKGNVYVYDKDGNGYEKLFQGL